MPTQLAGHILLLQGHRYPEERGRGWINTGAGPTASSLVTTRKLRLYTSTQFFFELVALGSGLLDAFNPQNSVSAQNTFS